MEAKIWRIACLHTCKTTDLHSKLLVKYSSDVAKEKGGDLGTLAAV